MRFMKKSLLLLVTISLLLAGLALWSTCTTSRVSTLASNYGFSGGSLKAEKDLRRDMQSVQALKSNKQHSNLYSDYVDDNSVQSEKKPYVDERLSRDNQPANKNEEEEDDDDPIDAATNQCEPIDCLINGEDTASCRRENGEVYLPFSFLRSYFEVYGKINRVRGSDIFEFEHSYSKYHIPTQKYDSNGVFMNFQNYNVETRDRVKCISALNGVPVSIQWASKGYFYPVQIAQFGLSHFSKNLTSPAKHVSLVLNGLNPGFNGHFVKTQYDEELNKNVLYFNTQQENSMSLTLRESVHLVLSFRVKFMTNGSLSVVLEDTDTGKKYIINYIQKTNNVCPPKFQPKTDNIYYSVGSLLGKYHRVTRSLLTDLRKGLTSNTKKVKNTNYFTGSPLAIKRIRVLTISIRGEGLFDYLTLSTNKHEDHFFDASDWLIENQDGNGGWAIPVARKFSSSDMHALKPGWYSAMAQGQAISLLTRAFSATKKKDYLKAALKGTLLYSVPSAENGVKAVFMNKYTWFEEYPTSPPSFVLNGFIYALLGLYDLQSVCDTGDFVECDNESKRIRVLLSSGFESLLALLPLFDTGERSLYDLRHFTLGLPPNRARWDYHTTHIDQLLVLSTINDSALLRTSADRWIGYLKGKKSDHN